MYGKTHHQTLINISINPNFRAEAWDTEREFETTGKTDKKRTAGRGKD